MFKNRVLAVLSLLCLLFWDSAWSFKCYFTLAKDNCWLKYDVLVRIIDPKTSKQAAEVTVPKNKLWARQVFDCEPGQTFVYQAEFSPVIWEAERGKSYSSHQVWSLPTEVNADAKAWNISVCYSKDFSEVPMPPEAVNTCACDFSVIPELKPE